ncbi:MAG: hypothetical protein ACRD8O_15300 [Bryobacteraceae bacterium]
MSDNVACQTTSILTFSKHWNTRWKALTRMSDVLRKTLDAMDRGQRLSDDTIADYRAQLKTLEEDRRRMEELLRLLWSTLRPQ